jgi:hypothetical protein
MVVSLLSPITAIGSQRRTAAADHHFAYPTVRPVPRPAAERREDPRAW